MNFEDYIGLLKRIIMKNLTLFFFVIILIFTMGCNSNQNSSYTSDTKSSNTKDGVYTYDRNDTKLRITVSGSSWSGSVKLCEFCDVEYQSGTINGENLYEGGSKIGYFSGETISTTIGGTSFTLRK